MNIFEILLLLLLAWRVVEGFKVGMVKEIISFISLVVMSVAVVLIGVALSSYTEKEMVRMVVAVILFVILCIVHRLLNLVFFSAKLISRLPVIHTADRFLGGVIGVLETVLIVWVIYALVMSFGMGVPGQQIILYTQESKILTWLYEHNYLAYGVGKLSEKINIFPVKPGQ